MCDMNLIMFWPHFDVFINWLPDENKKNKADTKIPVVMWCQNFDRKSTAPSSVDFC